MTKFRIFAFAFCAVLFLAFLASCEMPASQAPTAISQDVSAAKLTESVQTVQAQYTAAVGQLTSTAQAPSAASPQPPAATATPQADKPTATSQPPAALNPTATNTLQATATLRPSATPTATATFNPKDPRANLGAPTWQDSFDGSNYWYAYEDKRIRLQAKDGKLDMTAFKADHTVGWALTPQDASAKYYVEISGTFGPTCAGEDRWGLMIAPSSAATRGYLFEITCAGKYSLWMWNSDKATNFIIQTPSAFLLAGPNQTNRIGLLVDGNKLTIYANGQYLAEASDVTYDKDYFGVFVGATETDNFNVKADDLLYWTLK